MIDFTCDYAAGAHPNVMGLLAETNLEQTPGYGEDSYSQRARALIARLCRQPQAAVHLMVGGTQTNQIVIAALLRPHQGVICPQTGHIHTHETGAPEAVGHKVLPVPSQDGKLTAQQVEELCRAHWEDPNAVHTVQPGMVYISQPTELGTLYSLAELQALRETADRYGLVLYADGARLGYALSAPEGDVKLHDMARLCHVFTIGGTKVGALFGEAVVIVPQALQRDFAYLVKQRGAMLAKGRLLGIQFLALLEDGLYLRIARRGVEAGLILREGLKERGIPLLVDSPTNQQFPILPDRVLDRLREAYAWSEWGRVDDTHTAVRLCPGWYTTREEAQAFLESLDRVMGKK